MTNQPTDNGAQRPREIGYRRLSEGLAAEAIYNKVEIDAYLTALERERDDLRSCKLQDALTISSLNTTIATLREQLDDTKAALDYARDCDIDPEDQAVIDGLLTRHAEKGET